MEFKHNITDRELQAIERLIQEYKDQEEKAEWFKRLCNKNAEIARQLQSELEKKDKIIDYIIEFIRERSIYARNNLQRLILNGKLSESIFK